MTYSTIITDWFRYLIKTLKCRLIMKIWFSEDLRDDFYLRAFIPTQINQIKQICEMFPWVMQSGKSLTSHPSGHSGYFRCGRESIWVCLWLFFYGSWNCSFNRKWTHLMAGGAGRAVQQLIVSFKRPRAVEGL